MKARNSSNSERTRWQSCQHLWLMQYGIGLRQPEKPAVMYRGILWAEAVDALASDGIDGARQHLDQLQAKHTADADDYNSLVSIEETNQIFSEVRGMLSRYLRRWSLDPFNGFKVLASELRIETNTRLTSGAKSTLTGWLGIIDKLVQVNGRVWLLEHKATSVDLEDWTNKNEYTAQAPTYAWLVQQLTGLQVDGIIYDLANTKQPRKAEDFKLLKSGARLAKTSGLPLTTETEFARALSINGFLETDADWYTQTLHDLYQRDGSDFWFKREWCTISQDEIERTGRELYVIGTQMRRAKDATASARDHVRKHAADPSQFGQAVASVVRRIGHQYPRNQSQCWNYNRRCAYFDLCRNQSAEAAGAFVTRDTKPKTDDAAAEWQQRKADGQRKLKLLRSQLNASQPAEGVTIQDVPF